MSVGLGLVNLSPHDSLDGRTLRLSASGHRLLALDEEGQVVLKLRPVDLPEKQAHRGPSTGVVDPDTPISDDPSADLDDPVTGGGSEQVSPPCSGPSGPVPEGRR